MTGADDMLLGETDGVDFDDVDLDGPDANDLVYDPTGFLALPLDDDGSSSTT